MRDCACPAHILQLYGIPSKCLRIATNAAWCHDIKHIDEELRVPIFADHVRTINESFDSSLLVRVALCWANQKGLVPTKFA